MDLSTETRNDSYIQVQESAKEVRLKCMMVLEEGDYSAREVAEKLGVKGPFTRQYTAPRLTELENSGEVIVTKKKFDNLTERWVSVYHLKGQVDE